MNKQAGFTLVEVLAALVIMGMALSLAGNTLIWQLKLSKKGSEKIETQQALKTAMLYIEREIRTAKSVSLQSQGSIKIIRNTGQTLMFYVDDKDNNGMQDIYQQIDGTPTPLVSYVIEVRFAEQSPGCWEIFLKAKQGEGESQCSFVVKKRAS
jgi:prepilin-type N-terminal cleavage/methylation domain-containing protein